MARCAASTTWVRFGPFVNRLARPTGAANAGVPLAMIVQRFGWDAFFIAMTASCAVVLLLMAPMTNLKSYSQREAEGLVKAA